MAWLDLKDNDNFKVYDVTTWFKTNCNTDNYFKLISTEFNQYCSIQNGSIFQMQFKFGMVWLRSLACTSNSSGATLAIWKNVI